ncbi:MAG: glycosyltransferase, partial [Bacteroidia bacterium]
MVLINLIALILFVTCMVTVFYSLFFSIAGHFYRIKKYDNKNQFKKIAVFMPSYKEDEVILITSKHALLQNYPSHRYDVYVIADSLREETLQELKKLPIQVIPVSFDKSTKSKAINAAFDQIKSHYDLAVILDADNVMHIDF